MLCDVQILRRKPQLALVPLLLVTVPTATGRQAAAEVRIAGGPNAMDVEAKEASLQKVLTALRDRFGLRFESSASLEKAVTGRFHGSLEQVVSSLLYVKDYSYTYQASEGHPLLRIYGVDHGEPSNPTVAKPASPPPAPAPQQADQHQALPPPATIVPPHQLRRLQKLAPRLGAQGSSVAPARRSP